MMRLKKVGFFRELRHGDSEGPSLTAQIGREAPGNVAEILHYLRHGALLVGSPGVVEDVLGKTKKVVGELNILTDGCWAWPSDLAYYVENYNVQLPQAFVRHLVERGYRPPCKEDIPMDRLELL